MPDFSIVQSLPLPETSPATSYAGSRLLKGQTDILGLLDSKADQYGVPRNLVRTVASMESSLNPNASSGKAYGLMQLEPTTAKTLGVKNVWDPEQNADGGTRLLRDLVNKYNGDTRLVLAAYNAGEPAVDKAGGVPNYPETQKYVVKGLKSLPANLLAGTAEAPSPGPATQPTAAQAETAPITNGIPTTVAPAIMAAASASAAPVTLEDVDRILRGIQNPPAATAPPEPPPEPAFSVVRSLPLPPPPKPTELTPTQKAGWAFVQGVQAPQLLSPALSVLDVMQGKGLGPTVAAIPGQAQAVAQGIANELPGWTPSGGFTPGRALTEWGRTGESAMRLLRGDFSDPVGTLYHLFGSIPFAGGALQQIADKIGQGDAAAATGLTGAFLVQFLGPGAAEEVAPRIMPAVERAATAAKESPIGRATMAAAPDVAKGSAKMAAGTAIAKTPIPEVLKFGTGFPMVVKGGKQVLSGLKKGVAEFRTAMAEGTEAAPAAAAAPPVTPEPAPYTPGGPGYPIITPPPEPVPAAGLTLDDYARSIGKEPSKLSDADRARYQNLQNVVKSSQVTPTSPNVMTPAEGAQVFPGMGLTPETPAAPPGSPGEPPPAAQAPTRTLAEIQGEISQRLQNLQNLAKQPQTPEVVQQTTNELSALGRLKNEQPIPPGTVPAAPEAPPAESSKLDDLEMIRQMREENPTTFGDYSVISSTGSKGTRFWVSKDTGETVGPFATEAEAVSKARELAGVPVKPPVDPVAWTREQLKAGNRVSEATLQRQFGMKYSAARKLLKDLAPPTTSAEGQAAFEQAKATGQSAVTPTPEPPSDLEQQLAASIREAQARKTTPAPTVQPGQTVAEALAAQAPPGPKSLAELMAGIPERPELEKLDFAHITRTRNVERLYDTMKEAGITPEMVDAEGDAGWAAVAKKAKIGPKGKAYVPSETTKAQLRQRFAERR